MKISSLLLPTLATVFFITSCKETISNYVPSKELKEESLTTKAIKAEVEEQEEVAPSPAILVPPVFVEPPIFEPGIAPLVLYPTGRYVRRGGGGGGGSDKDRCAKIEGNTCNTGDNSPCDVGIIVCENREPVCKPIISACDDCNGETDKCGCPVPPENSIRRYVDPTGNNVGNDCMDADSPCQTIAYAISQAVPEDTLVMSPGTFPETGLIIAQDLFIFGRGAGLSIVQANGSNRVFTVNANVNASFCGLTITGGSISGFGGGVFGDSGSTVTITSSTISGNTASGNSGFGGGIVGNGSAVIIISSTISDNTARTIGGVGAFSGGSVTITNSTISGNTASPGNGGGGVGVFSSTVTITNSTISGNTGSGFGLGILNIGGTATITNSTISGNTSNQGPVAGGIYNQDGPATITNSTISGNTNIGIYNEGIAAITTITSSTISGNTGGGITNSSGIVNVANTIVADHVLGVDCSGTITDGTNPNLDKDGSCLFSITVPTFDLPLLANNGGPTQTHALVPGGMGTQAIDAGDLTCGVTTDQRGEPRPVNYPGIDPIDAQARCDIGAFEVQP